MTPRTPTWATEPTVGAACESLPFDEAADLFLPVDDGGSMRRTRAYPAPDSHRDARLVCARCPIIQSCLAEALIADPWTFRGGLSPEERAAFGGHRDPGVARARGVYLTRPQVWSRVVLSGLPVEDITHVLTTWREYLTTGDEAPLGVGDFTGATGSSRTPHEIAQTSGVLADDWFVEHVVPRRVRNTRRQPPPAPSSEPVQDALPVPLSPPSATVDEPTHRGDHR